MAEHPDVARVRAVAESISAPSSMARWRHAPSTTARETRTDGVHAPRFRLRPLSLLLQVGLPSTAAIALVAFHGLATSAPTSPTARVPVITAHGGRATSPAPPHAGTPRPIVAGPTISPSHSASAAPTISAAPTATPSLAPTPATNPGNLVLNPSFENGKSPWGLVLGTTAQGDYAAGSWSTDCSTATDGQCSAAINVTTANPTYPWGVQLQQENLNLSAGVKYTISFYAKASAARQISAVLQESHSPYTVYGQSTFNITTGWQKYTFTVTPSVSNNDAVRINLAQVMGTVWLDNVTVSAG